MNDAHKIAVLGRDVYILYVAEMVQNCSILLFFYTCESPKFSSISVVIYNDAVRSGGVNYGKYC
jgi:hypothetical protein